MDWEQLADRPPSVTLDEICDTLSARRNPATDTDTETDDSADTDTETDSDAGTDTAVTEPVDAKPIRVVADADVLAADLLVGGDARRGLAPLWQHSWTTLVASDALLADAAAVIETVADSDLAADWRAVADSWRESVTHPAGDHPALGSAYRGGAMHILSFDDDLTSTSAGAALTQRFQVSVRSPAAFARLFDPESLYPTVADDEYPGPDREPRFDTVQ
ncbi:MAG: hypothetical protein A07HN63_00622 [uncultured archaeon A07HN63]|nr:MAG: hypothetical protein A07HN63_00622 [uncultured archaeon A07HN63]